MIRKICTMFCLASLCACASEPSREVYTLSREEICPKIKIKEKDSAIIQKIDSDPIFEISIEGFEGFCYYDKKTSSNKAVVKPKVMIRRLSKTNISTVHFSYYLETSIGPAAYLGQKIYFEALLIPQDVENIEYVLGARELQIPPYDEDKPNLYLGLVANEADSEYRKSIY